MARSCANCIHKAEPIPGLYVCDCEQSRLYKEDCEPNMYCLRWHDDAAGIVVFEDEKETQKDMLSKRLGQAMGKAYTVGMVSQATGVPSATIRSVLANDHKTTLNVLVPIAKYLGVSLDWLCGLSDVRRVADGV